MGLVTSTINLESGMLVASKVGNLRSEFGPSGYRVIRYERDGRTDRRTDNTKAYCPLPYWRGITKKRQSNIFTSDKGGSKCVCPRLSVCFCVCLSVSKITQKRVHEFG